MDPDGTIQVLAVQNDGGLLHLNHSWENEWAHIVRGGGKVLRCRIGKLLLSGGEVAVKVCFREKSRAVPYKLVWMEKSVTPLHLLYANDLWKLNEVVSESDSETDGQSRDSSPELATLPWFTCSGQDRLTETEQRKLHWQITQVHNFQAISKGILPQE